jgi:hypothetical protein
MKKARIEIRNFMDQKIWYWVVIGPEGITYFKSVPINGSKDLVYRNIKSRQLQWRLMAEAEIEEEI